MCGRYKLELPFSEIVRLYDLTVTRPSRFDNMPARYNVAPTQDAAAVRLNAAGQREFVMLRWGLIPYWARDIKVGFSTINAMCEGVSDKPTFKEAFAKRPCLVLADGFYEWQATGAKTKQPYLIRMLDQQDPSCRCRNTRVHRSGVVYRPQSSNLGVSGILCIAVLLTLAVVASAFEALRLRRQS